jgi:hypothetical protein
LNHCGEFGAACWRRQHVAELVLERLRVVGGAVEVAVLLAPVAPAAGEAVELDLARVAFAARSGGYRSFRQLSVGFGRFHPAAGC